MNKNTLTILSFLLIFSLLLFLIIENRNLKQQLISLNEQVDSIKNSEEITTKKIKVLNSNGDIAVDISANNFSNGQISIYNKTKNKTIVLNGGNKDNNSGILVLGNKGEKDISFSLLSDDNSNMLSVYNKEGLAIMSIGNDKYGSGGYEIKNKYNDVIKTEGWGWRAYNYDKQ